MNVKPLILSVISLIFLLNNSLAQDSTIYKHPELNFFFVSTGDWENNPYHKDAPERCQGKTYNAIHIAQVWYPESKYQDNKKQMDDIIASLELEEQ